MSADWISFRSNIKKVIGKPNQITISKLAELHADEYANAVNSSIIIVTGSNVTGTINKNIIKTAYEGTFNALYKERVQLNPNYNNDKPTAMEKRDRKKIEGLFLPVALAISTSWINERFNDSILPPPYIAPTTGYRIITPGDPISLSKDLAKTFFISKNEIDINTSFDLFISSLISSYTKHLLKITGVFNGLVPGATNPIPGPPFPWIGVS